MIASDAIAALSAAEQRALALLEAEFACAPDFAAALLDAIAGELGVALEPPVRSLPATCRAGADLAILVGERPIRIALVLALRLAPTLRDGDRAAAAAAATLEARDADYAFTVLLGGDVAAARDAAARFSAVITLARISEMVATRAASRQGETARRVGHARAALDALRALSEPVEASLDASGAARFREAYLDLLEDMAPGLSASAVALGTTGLSEPLESLAFEAAALPRWPFMPPARLAHHVRKGVASIRLQGWGADIDGLASVMEPSMRDTDYVLSCAPNPVSGATDALIVAFVPHLDPCRPLDGQYEGAVACVRALRELQTWFVSRRAAARYWAEFAAPDRSLAGNRVRRGLDLD